MKAMFRALKKHKKNTKFGILLTYYELAAAAGRTRPLLFWAATGRDRPVPFTTDHNEENRESTVFPEIEPLETFLERA